MRTAAGLWPLDISIQFCCFGDFKMERRRSQMMKIRSLKPASHIPAIRLATLLSTSLILVTNCGAAHAQAGADKPVMLVTWFGPGAIALPRGDDWKPEMLTVYDNIQRPVAQYTKGGDGRHVSFIVFENHSGKPTSEGCREDAINPILEHEAKLISERADGEVKNTDGVMLATITYLLDMSLGGGPHQRNLFGFAGNSKTCAEIHISGTAGTPQEQAAMSAVLAEFHPDLSYQPTASDYFTLASLLFKGSPGLAAPYYKASLDAMPDGAKFLTARRVTTDQLVLSLGMSGDLKNSRAVAMMAIAADPDYPLNYYNLACADAEEGNAAEAKTHLQQAFDRRANVLKGESMPDPSKDDSILKLKKDKAFWSFVLTLPGR